MIWAGWSVALAVVVVSAAVIGVGGAGTAWLYGWLSGIRLLADRLEGCRRSPRFVEAS